MSDASLVPQPGDDKVFRQELFIPKMGEEYKQIERDANGNIIRKNHSYFIGAFDRPNNKFVLKQTLDESKGYVAKSPISGYGVFAKQDISAGELIEECPVVILDGTHENNKDWVLNRYAFTWSCNCQICKLNGQSMCLPLGNGMIYNHSDEPNAYYIQDSFYRIFRFYAFKDIKKDEEITWFYGVGYSDRLRKEKTLSPLGMTPEGMPSNTPPTRKGCGCSGRMKAVEIEKEPELLLEEPAVEQKSADELLFRSMIVPENILNDKI
jgi:hypothetical protein